MERQVAVIEPAVIQACAPDELRVAQRTGNANIDIARARSHQFCVRGEERREVQGAVQPQIEARAFAERYYPAQNQVAPFSNQLELFNADLLLRHYKPDLARVVQLVLVDLETRSVHLPFECELGRLGKPAFRVKSPFKGRAQFLQIGRDSSGDDLARVPIFELEVRLSIVSGLGGDAQGHRWRNPALSRSEEHTSELQSPV